MRTTLCAALLIAGSFALPISYTEAREMPTDISQKNKPATIKVLIKKEKERVSLEVKGRYHLYNPDDHILIDTGILGKREEIYSHPQGMKWGEYLPLGASKIRFVPGDSQTGFLVDGIQYRGCIEAYESAGKITIINEVDIENYLHSILSPLFKEEKSEEVLDAISICARTNAYFISSRNLYATWHVDAKEVGYQGVALAFQNPSVERAIEATRQMVLTYENTPFAATWTKDSAGNTAPFPVIFRKEVSAPQGIHAPIAYRDREKHHWTLTVAKETLAQIAQVQHLTGIDLFQEQNSKKIYALRIHDDMNTKDIDFFTLQRALGPQKLRSNDFTISFKKDNVIFSGYGEGHGVGLCLYSAKVMADHGQKAPQILATFFPESKLERMRTLPGQVVQK